MRAFLTAVAAASLCAPLSAVATDDSGAAVARPAAQAVSQAEALLFEADHLAGLGLPVRLEYRFSWNGESAFEDRVVLSIDAARRASVDYLSGKHHVGFPQVENAHGNPLLLYFLEHDLREMHRLTGGSVTYFRRLLRRAFADPKLAVEPVAVTVNGHKVIASRVRIEPYRLDPLAPQRYPRLAGKRYEFVLSGAVPGGIVNLSSSIPADTGETRTARLEWTGAQPL
jgi:hypothetical protein